MRDSFDFDDLVKHFTGVTVTAEISVPMLKRASEFVLIARNCMGRENFEVQVAPALKTRHAEYLLMLKGFPQYYRIILPLLFSSLEEDQASLSDMVEFVVGTGLPELESSDVRRLDAENLFRMVRPAWSFPDADLHRRALAAAAAAAGYLYPNRDLGYHLTHIVFYLTDFGRQEIISERANVFRNLMHVGAYAYLDDDIDLLAEVCICCHFLKNAPPTPWLDLVEHAFRSFTFDGAPAGDCANDDYHTYLCTAWALSLSERLCWSACRLQSGHRAGISMGRTRRSRLTEIQEVCFRISQVEIQNYSALSSRLTKEFEAAFGDRLAHLREFSPDYQELLRIISHGLLFPLCTQSSD